MTRTYQRARVYQPFLRLARLRLRARVYPPFLRRARIIYYKLAYKI